MKAALHIATLDALTKIRATRAEKRRAYLAIETMAGRNRVTLEGMRQLEAALPGAIRLAAQSLGITPPEFWGLIRDRAIKPKDLFLPFSKTITQEFRQ